MSDTGSDKDRGMGREKDKNGHTSFVLILVLEREC